MGRTWPSYCLKRVTRSTERVRMEDALKNLYAVEYRGRRASIDRRPPDPGQIPAAVELLKSAKRPVIIAGGGVHYSQAWDELEAFSEAFGIPVGETHAGRGAIRNGLTKAELAAVLHQIAVYAGLPAGVSCFEAAKKVFAEMEAQ